MTRKRTKQPHLRNNRFLLPYQPLPHLHRPNLPPHPPIHQHQHPRQHPQHTKKKQNPSPHPPKPPTTSSQARQAEQPPHQKRRKVKRLQQLPRQRRRLTRKAMRRIGNRCIHSRLSRSCHVHGCRRGVCIPEDQGFRRQAYTMAFLGNFEILVWNG